MNFQVTVLTSHGLIIYQSILFDKITLFISLVFDNAANYRTNRRNVFGSCTRCTLDIPDKHNNDCQ